MAIRSPLKLCGNSFLRDLVAFFYKALTTRHRLIEFTPLDGTLSLPRTLPTLKPSLGLLMIGRLGANLCDGIKVLNGDSKPIYIALETLCIFLLSGYKNLDGTLKEALSAGAG